MSGSNEDWGALAEASSALADAWDAAQSLPEPGEHPALDAFCKRKGLTIDALVKIGARHLDGELVFAGSSGVKYRDLISDKRRSFDGSTWPTMKIVRAGAEQSDTCIVAEGETDAAALTMHYDCDIAILPAGAKTWLDGYTQQMLDYKQVLLGLDNDTAGDVGVKKIKAMLPGAIEFRPAGGYPDWCKAHNATLTEPKLQLPELPDPALASGTELIVWGEKLLELEPPEIVSWLDHGVLPVGGQLIIHGWKGSFKSWIGFDLCASLAQGTGWANFESVEEPCKVCVIQFEIPWFYYQERARHLRANAHEPKLWDENFGTWTPIIRPTLAAGNTKHEDAILGPLVDAGVQIVLVDPIRRATGAIDMNAEKDVRAILGFFERLQREGITVVATHHDNKASTKEHAPDITSMTGSGAFAGDADTLASITVPRGAHLNDPYRNVGFYVRNGPPVADRGFQLTEGAKIEYVETFGADETEQTDDPSV